MTVRASYNKLLCKIYDWEREFPLRPTRPAVKYMRAILKESANAAAAVEMDQQGSGVSGIVVMLLTRAPTGSAIHKDYPEFFAYRDISFWWKYFLNPEKCALASWIQHCGIALEHTNRLASGE